MVHHGALWGFQWDSVGAVRRVWSIFRIWCRGILGIYIGRHMGLFVCHHAVGARGLDHLRKNNPDVFGLKMFLYMNEASFSRFIKEALKWGKYKKGNESDTSFQIKHQLYVKPTFTPTSCTPMWFLSFPDSSLVSSSFSLWATDWAVFTMFFSSSGYGVG